MVYELLHPSPLHKVISKDLSEDKVSKIKYFNLRVIPPLGLGSGGIFTC